MIVSHSFGSTFIPGDATVTGLVPDSAWSASLEATAPGIMALVDQQQTPDEPWTTTLQRLLPMIASTYQQKQLLDVQVQRAAQGLPPLDVSQYAPGVKVGLAEDTQRLLRWGGLAALALLAFMAMRR